MKKILYSLLILLMCSFHTTNVFANALNDLEKEIQQAIKEFQKDIKNLSPSDDPLIKSIDEVLVQMNIGVALIEESFKKNNVEATLSAINLVDIGLADVSKFIPAEKVTKLDHINYEKILNKKQIEALSLTTKDPTTSRVENMQNLMNDIDVLEKEGIKASKFVDNVAVTYSTNTFANGMFNKRVLTNIGTFASYHAVRRINNNFVEARLRPNQRYQKLVVTKPLIHVSRNWYGGINAKVVGRTFRTIPVRVWPWSKIIYDPLPIIVEEDNSPPEFWETDKYKTEFEKAYDDWRYYNTLSGEEFSKKFPKWPDGVNNIAKTYNIKPTYDGPPIEFEGLNEDGTCEDRKQLWCKSQLDFQKSKMGPTLVSWDDVVAKAEAGGMEGGLGPDFDPKNITNDEIDTSAFNNEVDKLNETVSQVTENISDTTNSISQVTENIGDTTDSINSFMEEVDNLNETIADISESIDSESITETVETITSIDELVSSFQSIGENLQESIQQVAEESEQFAEEMMQDTEQYLNDIANRQPCVGHIDMKTFEQTYSGDCD